VISLSAGTNHLKILLGWLIAGTKGGLTRARIIRVLKEIPQNANQLAISLKMDYSTIRHHLKILQKMQIIISSDEGYGTTYFLSRKMEVNYHLFEDMIEKVWKKEKREDNN
jgi:DNA-binding transcriptional ArsR family regulator